MYTFRIFIFLSLYIDAETNLVTIKVVYCMYIADYCLLLTLCLPFILVGGSHFVSDVQNNRNQNIPLKWQKNIQQ